MNDYDFLSLTNGQDDLANEVTSNHEAVMAALSKGAGNSVNVAFRLFLGLLVNLPLTLAFGNLYFVFVFWYAWWTRRRFSRNWWLDLALKYCFCLLWPFTILIFGFWAAKDLSQTRFAKERPKPDEVAESLQASIALMAPYWIGLASDMGRNTALTAALRPAGDSHPLAQIPIPAAFLDRIDTCQVCNERSSSPSFPAPKRKTKTPDVPLESLGAACLKNTSTSEVLPASDQPFSLSSCSFGSSTVQPIISDPLKLKTYQ